MKTKKKIAAIAVVFAFVAYSVSATVFLGSACPVYLIFGAPCPSCGITRAVLSFLTGNFSAAFDFHPLFVLLPIILILVALPIFVPGISKKKLYSCACVVIALAFVGLYVYRMIDIFPENAPMTYNKNSLLAIIWRGISDLFSR